MNTPTVHQAEDIGRTIRDMQCRVERDGKKLLIPCRPLGWQGLCLMKRLRLAWGVFTAQYDVLDWGPEQRRM